MASNIREQNEQIKNDLDQQKENVKGELKEQKDRAAREAEQAKERVKEEAKETKDTIIAKLREDGVKNPAGLATAAFAGLFLAAVPVTSFLAQPNGLLEKVVNGVCHAVVYLGSAGSTSRVSQTGKIAALSTLYVAMTYAFSGAGSAAGVDAGTEEGRDNNYPRKQVQDLQGLPLRLHSAHYNLLEMFGGFGLTAALAQTMAPGDQSLINLLGLHVISKVFLYYPAYLFNQGGLRSLAHVLATGSVINVALKLAKRPLL